MSIQDNFHLQRHQEQTDSNLQQAINDIGKIKQEIQKMKNEISEIWSEIGDIRAIIEESGEQRSYD